MSPAHAASPASLPPSGRPGLDPTWSRLVVASGRTWHVLDSGTPAQRGTLLCVHGNPTWSYLWRRLVAAPPPGWRVVAPDQLGMGWSERLEGPRTLAQRIADLGDLTDALGVDGAVVTVAHDWGGPISLGWALAHRPQVRGVVLANTAAHSPEGAGLPGVLRLARADAMRDLVCRRTPTFVRGATSVSWPALPGEVRDAYAAPYAAADRRAAVADFVADIPFEPDHPSAAALDAVAEGVRELRDVPALLLWGPRDPVFGEAHLRDLRERLPQAALHRYEGAGHLVPEDAPRLAADVACWVEDLDAPPATPALPDDHGTVVIRAGGLLQQAPGHGRRGGPVRETAPVWAALADRSGDPEPAVVELGDAGRTVSFATLAQRVRDLAAGLAASGVRRGTRVALLVPPSPDLVAAAYACWRAGAVVVVADAGLGARALGRALRGAAPDVVVGIDRGLLAAAALRLPGRRIRAGRPVLPTRVATALGSTTTLTDLARLGRDRPVPAPPGPDDDAAVVFTSGATGPPKGVAYRHRQVQAQVAALRSTYAITRDDRLVAAFAPFALYGPALGIATVVPDVDVTQPATLTAQKLAAAVAAVDATMVFAAPAALRTVVATAAELTDDERKALLGVRLVLSAGAPVPVGLLREVAALLRSARVHTPYGMTEALPLADVSLDEVEAAGAGAGAASGVCVGRPVPGVEVAVSPLDASGAADAPLTTEPGVLGEVVVRAAHVKDRYDGLWATERAASRDAGRHRTGDVGALDPQGRLWIAGRLAHVVTTDSGPVGPVPVEQRAEALDGVRAAACVGVGPVGTQRVVVVIVPEPARVTGPLAGPELAAEVRRAAGLDVAAVLVTDRLPVDVRHQSKVDRRRVAAWAEQVLSGGRARRRP